MSESKKEAFPKSCACVIQWNYPVINLGRNEYRNCCRTTPNCSTAEDLQKHGGEIILNSPAERERRARMLLGEKIDSCSSCWMIESKNVRSPRAKVDLQYHTGFKDLKELSDLVDIIPSQAEKIEFLSRHEITFSRRIKMLEIVLKNTCDMQCMYCSHHYSSRWAAERIKYGEITEHQLAKELSTVDERFKEQLIDWFRTEGSRTTAHVNFLGGEPSLIPEFYELSRDISDILRENQRADVELGVVTNLNSTPKVLDKFIDHLKAMSPFYSLIDIGLSIEAVGERAEYIRHGLVWSRWCENLERILDSKIKNSMISIMPAVNLLSISTLPDLIGYLGELSDKYDVGIGLKQSLVSTPRAHSPLLLTKEFVPYMDKAIEQLEKRSLEMDAFFNNEAHTVSRSWASYANFLRTIGVAISKHSLDNDEKMIVRNFFDQFDERRNLNIYKTFPEYRNFLKECGVSDSTNKGVEV